MRNKSRRSLEMLALTLSACATTPEPATQDSASEDAFCADAPTVDYNNFGEGFLLANCQGCHASTTANRHSAPKTVTFDTVDQVWAWAPNILSSATGDSPAMPPRGGIDPDDRIRLEWWLRCAPPGT